LRTLRTLPSIILLSLTLSATHTTALLGQTSTYDSADRLRGFSDGAFGVTVIVHGYQFGGTIPSWPNTMAEAIRDRITQGRIWGYSPGLAEFVVTSPYTGDAENILVFDWAADSNDDFEGHTEAAAEALFTALVAGASGPTPQWDLTNVHLIGHSRGAVVVSETAQRLLAAGEQVEHLTFLDPVWQGAFGQAEDFDVNANHPSLGTRGVAAWDSAGYVDNFYSTDDVNDDFFGIDGSPIPGARNLDLSGRGGGVGHSDVWRWYYGTIALDSTQIGGNTIEAAWYGGSGLARNLDGFNQSQLIGQARSPMTGIRDSVAFDWDVDGIVNGDFERGPQGSASTTRPDPGWDTYGGGGTGLIQSNELVLQDANPSRTHNPVWVPPGFDRISFSYETKSASVGTPDTLVVSAIDTGGTPFALSKTVLDGIPLSDTLTVNGSDFVSGIVKVQFELIPAGASATASVGVDDVRFEATPPGVTFASRIFLEGPFAGFGTMSTSLNPMLPVSQPYDSLPWSYAGLDSVVSMPSDIVDWVLVELRSDSTGGSSVDTMAALLNEDGYLEGTDGSDSLRFHTVAPGHYYAVIRHRNHLPVMSSSRVDLASGAGGWDFTTGSAFGSGPPMHLLSNGSYGMYACDIDRNGQITASDFNDWLVSTKAVETGYLFTDCNLDGQVTAADFNLWLVNTKAVATSQVPP
jgi:pimeloyl-ACP methyl ester carboxylesterase